MHVPLAQIEWNHWRIASVTPTEIIRVAPTPDQPRGRKAALMAEYWRKIRGADAPGVIWMDPDIVADPDDLEAMREQIRDYPEWVHVAAHKLWPASTMRDSWVWGWGVMDGNQHVLSQRMQPHAEWFALGLTYTPARLLDLALPHMPAWVFGQVDSGLGAVARQHRIPGRVVPHARPKHLHFYSREDDASWRLGEVQDQRKTG